MTVSPLRPHLLQGGCPLHPLPLQTLEHLALHGLLKVITTPRPMAALPIQGKESLCMLFYALCKLELLISKCSLHALCSSKMWPMQLHTSCLRFHYFASCTCQHCMKADCSSSCKAPCEQTFALQAR